MKKQKTMQEINQLLQREIKLRQDEAQILFLSVEEKERIENEARCIKRASGTITRFLTDK